MSADYGELDRQKRFAGYDSYIPPSDSFLAYAVADAIQWRTHLRQTAADASGLADPAPDNEQVLGLLTKLYEKIIDGEGNGVHDEIIDGHVVTIASYPDGPRVDAVSHVPDAAYPHKEHRKADRRAYRRLKTALSDLRYEASLLLRRLEDGQAHEVHSLDADRFDSKVAQIRTSLAELALLSEVREWHEADLAEAAGKDQA